jgi:hypothetical protein
MSSLATSKSFLDENISEVEPCGQQQATARSAMAVYGRLENGSLTATKAKFLAGVNASVWSPITLVMLPPLGI